MVPTESGNDGKRPPPSCRDKGWMWSRVGAWCLSWWHDEWSGLHEANRSPPHQDKHQAPSSTLLHPLSLQDAGRTFPHLVVKVHQLSGRLVRSRYVLLASPRTKRCITSSHKSSSRSFPWRISGCSGLCRI